MLQNIHKLAKGLLLFVLLLPTLGACTQGNSTGNKLVVYIVGFGEQLSTHDAVKNGGYGYEATFYSQGGVQPYFQATSEFKNAQSLVFSYQGFSSDGKPDGFPCTDTYNLKLDKDVTSLGNQIGAYLQSHPNTEVYLVGHSLGGVIAFAYMAQIVESTHSTSLLNGGELRGVAILDSPLNGVTNAKGYETSMIYLSDGCIAKTAGAGIDYTIVGELQTLGNTGQFQGQHASILGALLNGKFVSNQQAAEDAAKAGIRILIVGNTNDLLWQPNFCGLGPNFLSTQYLSEVGKIGKGALYVRSFTSPSGNINANAECSPLRLLITQAYHFDVVHNTGVQKAIWEVFTGQNLDVRFLCHQLKQVVLHRVQRGPR
jgi:pimeloyl-ACP methyl ester carboxylesterase